MIVPRARLFGSPNCRATSPVEMGACSAIKRSTSSSCPPTDGFRITMPPISTRLRPLADCPRRQLSSQQGKRDERRRPFARDVSVYHTKTIVVKRFFSEFFASSTSRCKRLLAALRYLVDSYQHYRARVKEQLSPGRTRTSEIAHTVQTGAYHCALPPRKLA